MCWENYSQRSFRRFREKEGEPGGRTLGRWWEERKIRGRLEEGSDSQRAEEEGIVRRGRGCLSQTGRAGCSF